MAHRTRHKLHFNHEPAFRAFCAAQGWTPESTDAPCVAMRFRKGKKVALVYRKIDATQHFTVFDESAKLARDFLATTRVVRVQLTEIET